ncbi:hypothetical protein [Microvirga sp. BSC39]|uniref:hypothetical protein n=1 Tax=Microvirga sp. BSC39 TaxID=1549810 RepID=UPI0012698C29|nr:hypothetical protein [Microvirga sp. BSC39]
MIEKPTRTLTSGLYDPQAVIDWADDKVAEGKLDDAQRGFYKNLYDAAVKAINDPDTHWVKLGYIEDRTYKHYRHPGQAVMVWKKFSGPLEVALLANDRTYEPDAMIFDKYREKGSSRRVAYGFYDPFKLYDQAQAEKAFQQAAEAKAEAIDPAEAAFQRDIAGFMQ